MRMSLILLSLLGIASAQADNLPEPLDLTSALSTVNTSHPVVLRERARRDSLLAAQRADQSSNGWSATLEAQAKYIEPPANSALNNNDSNASISLDKVLYDFNQLSYSDAAWNYQLNAQQWREREAIGTEKLRVARLFFDVTLSDLRFAVANEAMASAFVGLDKTQERHALGQVSDIDLLAAEDAYQKVRLQRYRAERAQRSSRALLAEAMNRPTQLPTNVVRHDLPGNETPLPDFDILIEQAMSHNAEILALTQEIKASEIRKLAFGAERHPTISANLSANHYEQAFGSRTPFEASVTLSVPLLDGGSADARVAQEQAKASDTQAQLTLAKHRLRERILSTWQTIETLLAQREQARVGIDYRDLYFDRSRALYELDIATDFGDAMVEQSAAILFQTQTEYDLALAWMQLAQLLGIEDFNPLAEAKPLFEYPTQVTKP